VTLWHKYASIAYIAVLFGVIGHASSEFVSVLCGVSGPELSVWRFLLGGAGLVIMALVFPSSRDLVAPFKTDGLRLVLLSVIGVTLTYLLFHWSIDFATVPQVATMVTVIPIFVGLSNLWLNKQPISTPKIITGTAALIGVALLITDGYLAKLAGSTGNLFGVFLALGTAAIGATYAVMVRPIIGKYGAIRITAITMMMGAIGLWIVVGLFWKVWVNPATLFDRPDGAVASIITLALWNTTITQFLWIGGLAAVPDITRGSYLFFLKPVIAAFLAVVFLRQNLTTPQMMAVLVICSSVFIEAFWPRFRQSFGR
jgi:drug/metabolite transporter (DMT)-like permease